MEEHYLTEDRILPGMRLDNPCEIRIDITEDRVSLTIGQRDFGWKRGCPDATDAGTVMRQPIIEANEEY
jgi:hypothetical protein